jgi:hypothetical protein
LQRENAARGHAQVIRSRAATRASSQCILVFARRPATTRSLVEQESRIATLEETQRW